MKILYVTTVIGTMTFFEEEFKHLTERGYTVELACNYTNKSSVKPDRFGLATHIIPFSRSPLAIDNIKAYKQLKLLIDRNHYDVVHCHTPIAAAIARSASRDARKKGTRVIYTAHGFHFYQGAPIKNWMLYYSVELLCARWTDVLITINREDYELAKRRLKVRRIEYVPGVGIDLSKFGTNSVNICQKREEINVPQDSIVLLSVGELNKNKNHETVIRALNGLDAYYVIAGTGERKDTLIAIAKELGVHERLRLLGYRNDVNELLNASDIFVFPSFREGLSVSLMETMATAKPAVVSRIRGNVDLIDEQGGALFNPYCVDECKNAIQKVINADRKRMGLHNREKINDFSLEVVLEKIDSIYEVTAK